MAFSVVASWDFRGGGSESVKLTSRIGGLSLTKQGTPTIDTNGVTCDTAGEGLRLTLPAGLKYTEPFWLMYGMRRIGAISGGQSLIGFIANAIDEYPRFNLAHIVDANEITGSVRTNSNDDQQAGPAELDVYPVLDTDQVWTLRRISTEAGLYLGSTAVSVATGLTGWPQYTGTSHLAVGCRLGVSVNPQMRYHWLLIGTGAITTGEMAAIQSNPNAFIYGAPNPAAERAQSYPGYPFRY